MTKENLKVFGAVAFIVFILFVPDKSKAKYLTAVGDFAISSAKAVKQHVVSRGSPHA